MRLYLGVIALGLMAIAAAFVGMIVYNNQTRTVTSVGIGLNRPPARAILAISSPAEAVQKGQAGVYLSGSKLILWAPDNMQLAQFCVVERGEVKVPVLQSWTGLPAGSTRAPGGGRWIAIIPRPKGKVAIQMALYGPKDDFLVAVTPLL